MKSLGSLVLGKTLVGTDELRKSLTSLIHNFSDSSDEVIVTQHGRPVAVLLDIASYIKLQSQKSKITPSKISEKKDVENQHISTHQETKTVTIFSSE